ncbi:MAG: hypothetical protein JW863_16250 [Chitinispirillaceae bacterium]|nr:hypothetical protein [Chitinispirillaceae bacterium]
MIYDSDNLAIAGIHRGELDLDVFPNNDTFSGYYVKPLPLPNNDTLYVNGLKFLYLLDWKNKKVISFFEEMSRAIEGYFDIAKVVDDRNILSLWYYFPEKGDDRSEKYFFVIDDVLNRKRIKEVPLPKFQSPLPVFFTPSFVFYQYTSMDNSFESPWYVIDNNLNQTSHPLASLLNENSKDTVYYVGSGKMKISENLKHALIIAYNLVKKKDMLYLATWYGDPGIYPVPIDSSLTGNRRLIKNIDNNTMSPSGHWVYFCARAERFEPDRHFLIYLDPKLPDGYLPPMRLGVEGTIGCAGWVTEPEGLMLYMNNQLLYWDLSRFSAEDR